MQSLQFKATVLVVALTLGVTAVVTSYFLQVSLRISQEEYGRQLRESASMLSTTLGYTWERYQPREFQALINAAVEEGPLDFVRITDVRGRPRAVAYKPGSELLLREVVWSEKSQEVLGQPRPYVEESGLPSHMTVIFPIRRRSVTDGEILAGVSETAPPGSGKFELLGYVGTGMTVNRYQRTMASRIDLLTGLGMVAGTMAIILGFMLIRRIVSPLDSLADNMDQFSNGILSSRSTIDREDEIGKLAFAFNRMADEHQKTLESLIELNSELEQRVADRTRQLQELASRDPLTGVFNRRHFNEMLDQHFAQAERQGQDLACVMIDLDDFKQVNDKYGHDVGDQLLIMVAKTIEANLRKSDICARYGGDEFVALLPQSDLEHATSMGERILHEIDVRTKEAFPDFDAAISLGVTSYNAIHAEDATSIIIAADRAMYAAKRAGKGRVVTSAGN